MIKKLKTIFIVSMIVAVLFSGCIQKDNIPTPTPTGTPTGTLTGTPTDTPVSGKTQEIVDMAKEDLANRLSISTNDIKLSNLEEVTWPTSALGYPKKDEQYLQVETKGYKIFLSYGEKIYEYHSDFEKIVPPPEENKEEQ